MKLPEAFARVLYELRTAKGLTHEQLAEMSGLHATFISLLERGGRLPSLNTVFLLAEALGVPPHEILKRLEALGAKPVR